MSGFASTKYQKYYAFLKNRGQWFLIFFSKYLNSKEKLTGLFQMAITQLPLTEKKKNLKTLHT